MMTGEEMLEMRMKGATYKQIADMCGITKQRVHQKIAKYSPQVKAIRRGSLYLEEIKYKGIYEYFRENLDVAFSEFVIGVYGCTNHNNTERMRCFLRGKHEVRLDIKKVKRICEIVGKPFEEVFKERGTADTSVSLVDGYIENDFDSKAFWEDTN